MTVVRWEYAAECLERLPRITVTKNNLMSCVCWIESENSNARWNPFDTEEGGEPGESNFNNAGVKNYPTQEEGIDAFVRTIQNGHYNAILLDLENDEPMAVTCSTICNSVWGSKPTSALQATVARNYDYFANLPIAGSTEGEGPVATRTPAPTIQVEANPVDQPGQVPGTPASAPSAPADNLPVVSNEGLTLNAPVVAAFPAASGQGYYLIGADGGVQTKNGAQFVNSLSGVTLNQPIVAGWCDKDGYYLVAADGGKFNFLYPK